MIKINSIYYEYCVKQSLHTHKKYDKEYFNIFNLSYRYSYFLACWLFLPLHSKMYMAGYHLDSNNRIKKRNMVCGD